MKCSSLASANEITTSLPDNWHYQVDGGSVEFQRPGHEMWQSALEHDFTNSVIFQSQDYFFNNFTDIYRKIAKREN